MTNTAAEEAGPQTERFIVPMGRYLGYAVVIAGALLSSYALTQEGWGAIRLIGFAVAFALVAWVVLIRPQVTAHTHGLLMRNMVRDTFLPWASIKSCRVAQTLQIGTRDKVYHGLGVSKSARAAKREWRQSRRQQTFLGPNTGMSALKFAPPGLAGESAEQKTEVNMAREEILIKNEFAHTEQRIERLAMQGAAATTDQTPTVAWDPVPVVALVGAAVAVLAALLI